MSQVWENIRKCRFTNDGYESIWIWKDTRLQIQSKRPIILKHCKNVFKTVPKWRFANLRILRDGNSWLIRDSYHEMRTKGTDCTRRTWSAHDHTINNRINILPNHNNYNLCWLKCWCQCSSSSLWCQVKSKTRCHGRPNVVMQLTHLVNNVTS